MKTIDIGTREQLEIEMDNENVSPYDREKYIKENYSRVSIEQMIKYGKNNENIE